MLSEDQRNLLLKDAERDRLDALIKAQREHDDKIKAINRGYEDRRRALLAELTADQPQDMPTGDQPSDS